MTDDLALQRARNLLQADPELAERTRAYLAHLEDEEMADKDEDRPVTIRLPAELLARVEALAPELQKYGNLRAVNVTRAAVLRLALLEGLEVLEWRALESMHDSIFEILAKVKAGHADNLDDDQVTRAEGAGGE